MAGKSTLFLTMEFLSGATFHCQRIYIYINKDNLYYITLLDPIGRRAGWGFSLICGLSQDKWPSKMGTYHWEGHQVFLMHICRVQSQVPFSGVCAHLRDLAKNGTGTYHWEVTGICVQTSELGGLIPLTLYFSKWDEVQCGSLGFYGFFL